MTASTASQDIEKFYDDVPYYSAPIAITRPEAMEAVVTLRGGKAVPISTARILELGCASGGNLIPLATRFPESQCIGIDISGKQIRDGQQLVEKCGGLPNLQLRHASITDIDASWGEFDYIICHGVFSWVPDEVRTAILRVCRDNLSPNGIAMLSFNAYPGWKAREIIRGAMQWAARSETDPAKRLAKARAAIAAMDQHKGDNALLGIAIGETRQALAHFDVGYVMHEFLEHDNVPFYLADFVELIRNYDLEFAGDTAIATLFTENYPESVQGALKANIAESPLDQQQLLDFLVSRSFRQAVLVRAGAQLSDQIGQLDGRYYQGSFRTSVDSAGKPLVGSLTDRDGLRYDTQHPVFVTVADVLSHAFPASVGFDELVRVMEAKTDATPAEVKQAVAHTLRMMVSKGSVASLAEPSLAARKVSDKPKVPEFERRHIESQFLANPNSDRFMAWSLLHIELRLDTFGAWLASQLDGTRDVQALIDAAMAAIKAGLPIVPKHVGNVTPEMLAQTIPLVTENLRANGLIMQ